MMMQKKEKKTLDKLKRGTPQSLVKKKYKKKNYNRKRTFNERLKNPE